MKRFVTGHDRATRLLWTASSTAAAVVIGVAVRQVLEKGWQRFRHEDPPRNPADPFTDWPAALAWGAVVGMGVGIARVFARRGAAGTWERLAGHEPPDIRRPSRARRYIRDRLTI